MVDYISNLSQTNVAIPSNDYNNVLHYLARTSTTGKDQEFCNYFKDIVALLIERVDVNAQNNKGKRFELGVFLRC